MCECRPSRQMISGKCRLSSSSLVQTTTTTTTTDAGKRSRVLKNMHQMSAFKWDIQTSNLLMSWLHQSSKKCAKFGSKQTKHIYESSEQTQAQERQTFPPFISCILLESAAFDQSILSRSDLNSQSSSKVGAYNYNNHWPRTSKRSRQQQERIWIRI